MELADILPEESVIFVADKVTKPELLRMLAKQAAAVARLPAEIVREAIEGRERLGSTGLGNGIAIPHGKVGGIDRVHAVFARLAHPMDFDAVDDQPVDLVMVLLAPLGAGADHLKALAMVARILRTEVVVERLRAMQSSFALHEALTRSSATHQAA